MTAAEFRDWLADSVAIWVGIFAVAGFVSLIAGCFSWLWRKLVRSSNYPTLKALPRSYCPKCNSSDIELLFGASDDFECHSCGLIWYI